MKIPIEAGASPVLVLYFPIYLMLRPPIDEQIAAANAKIAPSKAFGYPSELDTVVPRVIRTTPAKAARLAITLKQVILSPTKMGAKKTVIIGLIL